MKGNKGEEDGGRTRREANAKEEETEEDGQQAAKAIAEDNATRLVNLEGVARGKSARKVENDS